MTNPTTPFNWQMPTASDLVTDLPADFETFGQAVATSMADLLGGTTGQILAKNSNTDMDFVWTSPNPGDITAVTAGTGISGGGTSGDVTITNSMATAIDAKGDLIAGTGADTFSRLAAGNNGETLVADSSTSTGLRYQANWAAGKNKIINGDFGIWQRGTSFSTTTDMYTADRFFVQRNNTNTISQQTFTPGTAPVAGYEGQYFLRYARTTVAGGTDFFYQRIEDVRTFAGQTVTFSFWAKANTAIAIGGVEIDQVFGSGGSGTVTVTGTSSFSVTTDWVRYSYTVALPSISGKTIGTGSHIRPRINFTGTAATFDTWGWQIEASNTATAFQTATGTIQGELAACQRYYQRIVDGNSQWISTGANYSAGMFETVVRFAVAMRIAPTLVASTGTDYYSISRNGGTDPINSLTLYQASPQSTLLYNNSEVSGTAGHAGNLFSNNASSSLAFNSEL